VEGKWAESAIEALYVLRNGHWEDRLSVMARSD
jgi:hypothetical protein